MNYGRRIVEITNGEETRLVISAQWVGHAKYGWEYGTTRQRANVTAQHPGFWVKSVSRKIFWNQAAKKILANGEVNQILPGMEVDRKKLK